MLCENTFCVYYFKGECLKSEEITLNNKGMCREFIQIEIEDQELERRRIKTLENFARVHKYQHDLEKRQIREIVANIKAKQKERNKTNS